ncbi:mitochondrial ATPase inhibitor, IATP-domain-containing protein [Morchella snyderi]|nr:mitochondrial ATPase inhibitor, IATP-domain-containing protein [Morchella snyderi]
MLRTTIARSLRINRVSAIAMSVRPYSSEGSTGSGFSRPAGEAAGDAFTKREKAAEDFYVRQQEKVKLLQLKEKLKQQRKHLDELDAHIEELTRDQGGEKN